jgi:hypothetical protein
MGLGRPLCLCSPGKDHVCRFIGCGRNEKFNYVVMQLQVCPWGPLTCLFAQELERGVGGACGRRHPFLMGWVHRGARLGGECG